MIECCELKSNTYLRGYAKTRCPKVTKLVSWLDINQASEETLTQQKKDKKKNQPIIN